LKKKLQCRGGFWQEVCLAELVDVRIVKKVELLPAVQGWFFWSG
jgi:hypothetical protein